RGPLAIGVDVGGTRVSGLLVDCEGGGEILDRSAAGTPATDAALTVETIVSVARELSEGHGEVAAIGIGAAGLVDIDGGVRFAPNIAWRDVPLAARVAGALGIPTRADNDATAAAWGEFRFGAGRGSDDMLLVTVGTGIGGGIVAGGQLFRRAHGFGAGSGHLIVEPGGPRCACRLLGPARDAFRDAVMAPDHRPEVPIVPAALGNDAGAVGAADLALSVVLEERAKT